MLKLAGVAAGYGAIQVLRNIDLEVGEGEIVCLLGGNAAGKSTTLKSILGLVQPRAGTIEFDRQPINGMPTEQIVRRGIALVPESRRIFARMSVWENLKMGAYVCRGAQLDSFQADLERVYALFPRLQERAEQYGGTLSGGEQQMLAIGRALMSAPRVLLIDEASLGLSPKLAQTVFQVVSQINDDGTTVVIVEQNVGVLPYADQALIMEKGTLTYDGRGAELEKSGDLRKTYLGT